IACGGGTPCFGDNMAHLRRHGHTIYLRPDTDELIARLRRDRRHRPLLRDIPEPWLDDHIRQMLAGREPFYQQAHHTLTTNTSAPKRLIDYLQRLSPSAE
ncbi:MAG: shikimate kinase, partial [Bacteroidetes bacterium]